MVGRGAESALENGIDSFESVLDAPMQLATALYRSSDLLKKGTENVIRTILIGQKLAQKTQQDADKAMIKAIEVLPPMDGTPMFLNQLSQDLRTPLSLVIAYSKMINDGLLGEINPSQEKAIQQVIKHSYRVLSIITGLLHAGTNGGLESAGREADSSDRVAIGGST